MTFAVHTTFLVNHENSCAHMNHFVFFNFVKAIHSLKPFFLMKECRKICGLRFAKESGPWNDSRNSKHVVYGTYDFLGEPGKFMCTYDSLKFTDIIDFLSMNFS